MISEIYKNRALYYNFMKDFLQKKISHEEFQSKYWRQRDKDLDKNKENGYRDYYLNRVLFGNDKKFKEKYCELLHDKGILALGEYLEGAKTLDIKGEMFFMGIWNFIDYPIKDYFSSNNEGFDPSSDVDEHTLIKIVQAVFDVLERNKERWMIERQEIEGEHNENNGQKI